MGKFLKNIWVKIFCSSQSESLPAGAPAPTKISKTRIEYIENEIDSVVSERFAMSPNLEALRNSVSFWQSVFKALAYAESGFNTECRYVEPPSLGKDAVTGRQNTSEGLLQLSYQDAKYHGCNFNWEEDKFKNDKDITKTIFNIENNISGGMMIMDKLVKKKGHFIFNDGNYWAVLKPNNKRHKVFVEKFNQYQAGTNV